MAGGVQAGGSLAKNHYEVLDGLRGVAALLVVAFHTFEPNDYGVRFHQIINHGYLAVDFFFLLSGFVVAYAYDDRWPRMSQWSFYKRRLIRLQPMIVMGSLIGAALFYFQKGAAFPLVAATPVWKMLAVMIFGFRPCWAAWFSAKRGALPPGSAPRACSPRPTWPRTRGSTSAESTRFSSPSAWAACTPPGGCEARAAPSPSGCCWPPRPSPSRPRWPRGSR